MSYKPENENEKKERGLGVQARLFSSIVEEG